MTNLIVIGGGPAGITAALEAATLGGQVTLLSAEPIGGRANWHSLVPSKVHLTAADHLEESQHFSALGLQGTPFSADLQTLRSRIVEQAQAWSQHQQSQLLERGIITIVPGKACFLDSHHVQVNREDDVSQTIAFDQAIIASGSEPVFLPSIKPDGHCILAPRHAGILSAWPNHMIVIGGGVTGAEFTYFFNRMGCRVTWVTDLPALLPRTDPDLAETLEETLHARGVMTIKSAPVQEVHAQNSGVIVKLQDGRRLTGSHAFIAIGRRPDLSGLKLESAGIDATPQGIETDAFGRTSASHIFAIGDVTGAPFIANRGQAQARIAARRALGVATGPFRPETVIEAIYTSPQIAQVGLSETQATQQGRTIQVYRATYNDALKPRLSGNTTGFIKLLAVPAEGQIVGGAGVGERAAEVLSPVAVAIAAGMTLTDLADLFSAHPTLADLVGIAARGY